MVYLPRFEQLKKEHCKLCGHSFGRGNERLVIHHIDLNHSNDNPKNLLIVCRACHIRLHHKNSWRIDVIRHMREQGLTLQTIADTFSVSRQRIHQLLDQEGISKLRLQRLKRELGREIKTAIAERKRDNIFTVSPKSTPWRG